MQDHRRHTSGCDRRDAGCNHRIVPLGMGRDMKEQNIVSATAAQPSVGTRSWSHTIGPDPDLVGSITVWVNGLQVDDADTPSTI